MLVAPKTNVFALFSGISLFISFAGLVKDAAGADFAPFKFELVFGTEIMAVSAVAVKELVASKAPFPWAAPKMYTFLSVFVVDEVVELNKVNGTTSDALFTLASRLNENKSDLNVVLEDCKEVGVKLNHFCWTAAWALGLCPNINDDDSTTFSDSSSFSSDSFESQSEFHMSLKDFSCTSFGSVWRHFSNKN